MENATGMVAMGGMLNRREVLVQVTFISNLFEPQGLHHIH